MNMLDRTIKSMIGTRVILKEMMFNEIIERIDISYLRGVRGEITSVINKGDNVMDTIYRISFDDPMSTSLPVFGWGLEWLTFPAIEYKVPTDRLGNLISELDSRNVVIDNSNSFFMWVKEEVLALLAEKDEEIRELKKQIADLLEKANGN